MQVAGVSGDQPKQLRQSVASGLSIQPNQKQNERNDRIKLIFEQ
jgi:hypothetical protein